MSKIEQNKKRKEQAILEAAQQAFLGEGYVLASMDKIAKSAQVTKQTVYRYYPSKILLFKATLKYMGKHAQFDFCDHLENADTEQALTNFAAGFIKAHISSTHLATYRLLVSESNKAPEIVQSFMEIGADDTQQQLIDFFQKRLKLEKPEQKAKMWSAMLLAYRDEVLFGLLQPADEEIQNYAVGCVQFLLI